jgi:transposase
MPNRCSPITAVKSPPPRPSPEAYDRRAFQLEKRRWKAEQTFGCLLRYRRLRVDDEMSCETSRGMAMLAALFMTGMRLERLITS